MSFWTEPNKKGLPFDGGSGIPQDPELGSVSCARDHDGTTILALVYFSTRDSIKDLVAIRNCYRHLL